MITAYKSYYNEDTKKVDYKEYLITNEFDFDHEPETNIDEVVNSHNCVLDSVIDWTNRVNRDLENGSLKIVKCKECGMYFFINEDDMEWYEYKGFALPKRCQKCRSKRRNNKKEESRNESDRE